MTSGDHHASSRSAATSPEKAPEIGSPVATGPFATFASISVIFPVYNEEQSLPLLADKLRDVVSALSVPYEVIAVNDGSTDRSEEQLRKIAERWPEFRVVQFRRNSGQTAAIQAGLDYSTGDIIIPIDSDLQNDPADIPRLLEKIDEGFDVVSGWRKDRKDAAVRRNFVSRVANRLISWISSVRLHDYGCTLKAYRRDFVEDIRIYGEMHRFIPIYASWMGASVTEIPVNHYPRTFGQSKYGLERTLKVILDLLVITFLDRYLTKPIYVFGGFAAVSIASAIVCASVMIYLKLAEGVSMILTPLPLLSAMLFLIGVLSLLLGLLAEIMVRTYFESQDRRAYSVRSVVNIAAPPSSIDPPCAD